MGSQPPRWPVGESRQVVCEERGGQEALLLQYPQQPQGPFISNPDCPDARGCLPFQPGTPPRGTHRISQAVEGPQVSAATTLRSPGRSHAEVAELPDEAPLGS